MNVGDRVRINAEPKSIFYGAVGTIEEVTSDEEGEAVKIIFDQKVAGFRGIVMYVEDVEKIS